MQQHKKEEKHFANKKHEKHVANKIQNAFHFWKLHLRILLRHKS